MKIVGTLITIFFMTLVVAQTPYNWSKEDSLKGSALINTIEHFRRELGDHRIHAIIGGTHLGPSSDEQFAATVDYLKRLDFDRLGVSHCTGQIRSAQLYAHFPNKVFFANVGSTLRI